MTRNMNNLFKMSRLLQKLATMSHHVTFIQSIRTLSYAKTTWPSQGNEQNQLPATKFDSTLRENDSTIIKSALVRSQSDAEIFKIIQLYKNQMSGSDAVQALESLFRAWKYDRERNKHISQQKEFAIVCNILKKHIRELSGSEAITVYKILVNFNVPISTVISQMLLKMISESINDVEVDELAFLAYLLSNSPKSPLVSALIIAIPIVFNANIGTKLDTENLSRLVNIVQYVGSLKPYRASMPLVMNAIAQHPESAFTTKQAMSVIVTMLKMGVHDVNTELLAKLQTVISKSSGNVYEKNINRLIRLICIHHYDKNGLFYHEGLIEACVATIISKDLGLPMAIEILGRLNKITYGSNALLDYIAGKGLEDSKFLTINPENSRIMIHGMTVSDYKPVFWDTIKESLLNDSLLKTNPYELITLSFHLVSLDCYWPKLLERTFSGKNERIIGFPRKKLVLLYHAVKNLFPEYQGPWPSDELLAQFTKHSSTDKDERPLKLSLENALGGAQYVLTNVATPVGYNVDHVVMMRKGGFPVAINNSGDPIAKNISDLEVLPDSQIILITYIPKWGVTINTQRLISGWSLIIKLLQLETKSTVIPIYEEMWIKLSTPERLRYISQAIRLKSDELSAVVNF